MITDIIVKNFHNMRILTKLCVLGVKLFQILYNMAHGLIERYYCYLKTNKIFFIFKLNYDEKATAQRFYAYIQHWDWNLEDIRTWWVSFYILRNHCFSFFQSTTWSFHVMWLVSCLAVCLVVDKCFDEIFYYILSSNSGLLFGA